MKIQNYTNHRKLDPIYHGIIVIWCVIGSILLIVGLLALFVVNMRELANFPWFIIAIFLGVLLISFGLIFMTGRLRVYGLKNQDRIIKLEEWFRYYVLTGKQIDPTLSVAQIAALRFACDEEFVDLCNKAIMNNMNPDTIKKSIKHRRADHQRI